ncbi:unnamed protein product, partial [Meganyctiphanes norvegica]
MNMMRNTFWLDLGRNFRSALSFMTKATNYPFGAKEKNAPGAPPVYNNYPYGSNRFHEGPFRQFNGQFPQGEFPPYAAGKMMEQPSPMMMDGPGKMMGGNYPQYGAGKMMGDFGGKMMGDNYPGSQHRGGFPGGENFNNMQHQGNFRDSYHQPTFGGNRRYQGGPYRPQYDNYQG